MTSEEQKQKYILDAVSKYKTQTEAAEAFGTSPRVVWQWASGKHQPRELAVRVVQLLEVLEQYGIDPPEPLQF